MKEKQIFLLCLSGFLLTGCSTSNERINQYVMQHSGIVEDSDYQTYQKLQAEGKLNPEGLYNELEKEEYRSEPATEQKQVHITIANNSFLDIAYYYDPELTQKAEEGNIYLNPGEKLYCSVPKCQNAYSNAYKFQKFRIYEYDSERNGKTLFEETQSDSIENDSMVLEIPADYQGTELAVYPLGIYEKKELVFSGFYYDQNGDKKEVGEWSVNGEVYDDKQANISAGDSYIVEYAYDENLYYYVTADPTPYNTKVAGLVEFEKAAASDTNNEYSVVLHKFTAAELEYDKKGIASIQVNGEERTVSDGKLNNLKIGDKVTIITEDDYRVFSDSFLLNTPERIEGGYQYTFSIPEIDDEIRLKIVKSNLEITLDKSVGYDAAFDITGSELSQKNCRYSKQSLGKNLTVYSGSMGMEEKLTVFMHDYTLPDGKAFKVEVEKRDVNNRKTDEVQYIENASGKADIVIYDDISKFANLNNIYKDISIKISLVDVITFKSRTISNGTISVRFVEDNLSEQLSDGDLAEESRKVEVTISPDSGFYVSGKNTDDYKYVSTMKLSKYEDDIDDIIESHEIKELYQVTLDTADDYGTCIYKLNGEEVSGLKEIREEDELVLEYEITDPDYIIVREKGGFTAWRKNTFSKRKETIPISIDASLNGMTIRRQDYIDVQKKGE